MTLTDRVAELEAQVAGLLAGVTPPPAPAATPEPEPVAPPEPAPVEPVADVSAAPEPPVPPAV